MELLDRLDVHQGSETKSIELYRGDLASMTPGEAVDILVVSAFPGDYSPTRSSLIGALWARGVRVEDLARQKEVDLRRTSSCWLSAPLGSKPPGIAFDRILCFEPRTRGKPPEVVGDIFRSLVPFLGLDAMGTTVAMPLVACGDQGVPVASMLSPLLEAAFNWMSHGLPLNRLKIVVHSAESASEAQAAFAQLKLRQQPSSVTAAPTPAPEFGVFISYAHKDWDMVTIIVGELRERRKDFKVFLDRTSPDPGVSWQQKIYEALEKCRKVIVVLSPAYLESKRCLEEYNLAHCRQVESGEPILYPILLNTASLPIYIRMLEYVDCREGNVERLRSCCSAFLTAVQE
jgi:TIR domain